MLAIIAAATETATSPANPASVPLVAVITAAIAALPPTLLALATLVSSRKNNAAVKATAKVITTKTDEVHLKADQLVSKTEEIGRQTNGTLTKLHAQLELSEERYKQSESNNKELRELLVRVLDVETILKKRAETSRAQAAAEPETAPILRFDPTKPVSPTNPS